MTTITAMHMLTGSLILLLILVLMHFSVLRAREKRRQDWLAEYRRDRINYDNATCANLRAVGWPESRIRAWCNNSRCIYYPPDYDEEAPIQ